MAAVRYVERNPVRAGLVRRAEEYPWSSAGGHTGVRDDPVLSDEVPFRFEIADWRSWLAEPEDDEIVERLRQRTAKGLPCGSEAFIRHIERLLGRSLEDRSRGRPKKTKKQS
jgi:putative transposase